LICDLCSEDQDHVVRVNKWTVCNECSSNGPLQTALEAYDAVVKLRKAVQSTSLGEIEGKTLQKYAEHGVRTAQSELEIAINALIPAVGKSAEARVKAVQALERLGAFEELHPYLTEQAGSPTTNETEEGPPCT
jgi:hypothetical protein